VVYKHTAENTMSLLANFVGKRNRPASTTANEYITAAQNLYHHLREGFVGKGLHRIPIAGDTTRLPFAEKLSRLERRLAWALNYLARHMPGSQQLRQVMGQCHFGARVVYGDCVFFTISPNEQHSCLVLRLSRFRRNDPYLQYKEDDDHKNEVWQSLARADTPLLEQKRRKVGNGGCQRLHKATLEASPCACHADQSQADVEVILPEYDLRRKASLHDPLAVVNAYRIEIYLRLAAVLGVRMCPHCPRCNHGYGLGCQDRFGSNMRPTGGVLGGMTALGGATEYQGNGTPHFHAEGHIVCAYQYDTMEEIAAKFRAKTITLEEWKAYGTWLHHEDDFVPEEAKEFEERVYEEFNERFKKPEHNGLVATPEFLMTDADTQHRNRTTVSDAATAEEIAQMQDDGIKFKNAYFHDLQFIFSRVQHHVHKKTAEGCEFAYRYICFLS
jgi:hypothetical protein